MNREEGWPPLEELVALLIERSDVWFRALVALLSGEKRFRLPGELELKRPGHERRPDKQITTNPADLANWLRARGGGGPSH